VEDRSTGNPIAWLPVQLSPKRISSDKSLENIENVSYQKKKHPQSENDKIQDGISSFLYSILEQAAPLPAH
jgi:hypothetical protein